jgi:hypothetical protein
VKAILDANRNALMLLELRFSVWTLGLGAGTFIAALYGMNLKNFIEESDAGFVGISVTCAVASVFVLVYGLKILRRVQRVSMWGSHSPPALPQARLPARELQEIRAERWEAEREKKTTERMREQLAKHDKGPLWSKRGVRHTNNAEPSINGKAVTT